jgi:hypothetical protein
MTNNILTAEVAIINIGNKVSIEGLRLEDGRFAVAVRQVASLFQLLPNSTQKWLKSLLGKEYSYFQVKTNREEVEGKRVRRPEQAISISDFRKVIRLMDKKGHPLAETIADALTELSLEQLFADGFKIDLTPLQRQQTINRVMSKPRPPHPVFGDESMNKVANFLKCGRGSAKIAKWMWNFIYEDLDSVERADLNSRNPIQPNGCRKQTIHSWLTEDSVSAHKHHFDAILLIIDLAQTEQEFNELYRRKFNRTFQSSLF